jgi:geranylgeranyl diphosphate synthase, type I
MPPTRGHRPSLTIPAARGGSPPPAPGHSLAVRTRIEAALTGFLAAQAQELAAIGPEAAALTGALERFVRAGGKRLRPVLCYWGWRGAGGGPEDPGIITAAASLELLHAFALVHDDIMDASDTRRGVPTVHRAFTTAHAAAHWHGNSESFGVGAGILAGNMGLILSDALVDSCGLPAARVRAARVLLATTRAELAVGQYLDLHAGARRGFDTAAAARVIRYKTAKYTVERPLQIGGVLAGANQALLAAYTTFGIPWGEAFQLHDDLLGAYGDQAVTGKSTIDDFREGKPTWLIALAFQHATGAQRQRITALHGDPDLDDDGAAELREIITATGAREQIENLITTRTTQALSALHQAPLEPGVHTALTELLHAATIRTA